MFDPRSPTSGGCWPTPSQELLLRAALLRGPAALAAWKEWQASISIDALDVGSQRLLPLLHHNLRRHGVEDDRLALFKGVRRYAVVQNHLLFARAAGLLRDLHAAGIETMVLKGAPLVVLHYRDHGLRPMNDVDVLVRPSQAAAAVERMLASGWTPEYGRSTRGIIDARMVTRHGFCFRDAEGREVDLHRQVLEESRGLHTDAAFWDHAVPVTIHGEGTLTLDPTDQLLHVCAHGVRWNHVPPLRWVADAMAILQSAPEEIDWDRLVARAGGLAIGHKIRTALWYVHDLADAAIPAAALRRLDELPVSKTERLDYRLDSEPRDDWSPRLRLRQYTRDYMRWSRASGRRHGPSGPLRFLQHFWELEHLRQLPLRAVQNGSRAVRMMLSRRSRERRTRRRGTTAPAAAARARPR